MPLKLSFPHLTDTDTFDMLDSTGRLPGLDIGARNIGVWKFVWKKYCCIGTETFSTVADKSCWVTSE